MSDFYDPDGNMISLIEWTNIWKKTNRVVAKTDLPGGAHVSTVYLGLDHRYGYGPPLIYETIVFNPDEVDMQRYSTREEALAGHAEMVAKWTPPSDGTVT